MSTASAAFVVSLALSAALGVRGIPLLRRLGARQTVSTDAPTAHVAKQGTPTMGGLLILVGLVFPVAVAAIAQPWRTAALPLLALTLAFGVIGFLDDYLIARRGKNLGLKARQKLALQFLVAIVWVLWLRANANPLTTVLWWSGDPRSLLTGGPAYRLGDWYYVLAVLFIVGLSNAVNFMDGLDGMAAGVCAILALALTASVAGSESTASLAIFAAALAGGCAGFLWYNTHPAQVFMGDTGSLALGAALAGMALTAKVEVPFQVWAIVPWAELFSVMVQVAVFKIVRRQHGLEYAKTHRVFRRTPLHHHFEELGWPETRVVGRFWLVTAASVAAMMAIAGVR